MPKQDDQGRNRHTDAYHNKIGLYVMFRVQSARAQTCKVSKKNKLTRDDYEAYYVYNIILSKESPPKYYLCW